MGILGIPNELLLEIAEHLSIRVLYHFLSTCRRLRHLLSPRLHNLGVQDINGLTALQWAAERGHASLAELAISRGAEIDEPRGRYTGRGRTPLHSAAEHNHSAVIRVLVNNGASTAARDIGSQTPLHLAAGFGNEEATRALLELGADMTCRGTGSAPVYHALQKRSLACMKAFIDAGFDFNSPVFFGATILHAAAGIRSDMMEYLLGQEGAKIAINAQDADGCTPLHWAIKEVFEGQRGIYSLSGAREVRLLLNHGANMEVRDNCGDTAAHSAVHWPNVECLKVLLEAGFDTNIRATFDDINVSGRTILHEAVICSEDILSFLVGQEGGRVIINAQDSQGSTALHLAAKCGGKHYSVPWYLAVAGRDRMNCEKVRLLVQHGANPRIKDKSGNTPAHITAYTGDVDCMKSLIQAGIDINSRGLRGRTILHEAISGGMEMMEYLLKQKGIEVIINAQDDEGLTPLDLAARRGVDMEAVRLLLRYGANTKENDSRGGRHTPPQAV